jgi:hypothetical protein
MNFILSKTIITKSGKCVYKLYEFKLTPGHYHAKLTSQTEPGSVAEFNFTKRKNKWETSLRSKEAKRLAEIFGNEIDKMKN